MSGIRDALIGALVGAIITGGVALYVWEQEEAAMRPGELAIDSFAPPSDPNSVPRTLQVSGTADIPSDSDWSDVWIAVKVGVNAAVYPQGIAQVSEGRWTCTVTLGSQVKADDGPYSVIAFLANSADSDRMRAYVRGELATDIDGMQDFPREAQRRDSIAVTRNLDLPSSVKRQGLGCQ